MTLGGTSGEHASICILRVAVSGGIEVIKNNIQHALFGDNGKFSTGGGDVGLTTLL